MKMKLLCAFSLIFVLQACSGGGSSNNDSGGNKGTGSDKGAGNTTGGGNNGMGNGNAGGANEDTPAITDAKAKCANTPTNPGVDIRYVYSQTINGQSCTTGCQIFNSVAAACSGLQNEQLNNNCAKDTREQSYHDSCLNP